MNAITLRKIGETGGPGLLLWVVLFLIRSNTEVVLWDIQLDAAIIVALLSFLRGSLNWRKHQ